MKKTFTLVILFVCFSIISKTQTPISGIINNYAKVDSINFCSNTIHVPAATAFSVGDRVLLIQMKGATVDLTNNINFGNITAYNSAGNYEFGIIASKSATSVTVQNKLLRTYETSGIVQLVRVPVYDDVSIDAELTSLTWNGATGGILVFEADQITINANMNVSGKGFRGGNAINFPSSCPTGMGTSLYFSDTLSGKGGQKGEGIVLLSSAYLACRGKAANGGGGGNDHNAGGGGGCMAVAAGVGGENDETLFSCPGSPGQAGIALDNSDLSNKIYMGGGGGSGHGNNFNSTDGGNGGGIIIIKANEIIGSLDSILSNGNSVTDLAWGDGAGGGGAGGSIFIDVLLVIDVVVQVNGGKGGDSGADQCTGPGGGGSGGVIKASATTVFTGGALSATGATGGTNTTVTSPCFGLSNGAAAGSTGEMHLVNLTIAESLIPFNADFADAGPDQSVCLGSTVILEGSGGVTYSWFPTAFLDDPTASDPECTPAGDVNYTLTVTNAEGCSDADLVLVDVLPAINPDAGPDVSVCAGESVTLSASGGVNYIWSPVLYLDDPTISNPVSNPFTAITYTVTVTDANGCVGTDMVMVDVNPSDFLIASDDIAVCSGGSATLYAAGGSSYLWSPGTYLDDATSSTPVCSPLSDISYTVTSINPDGCSDSEIINVTVTVVDFLVLGGDVEVCIGDSIGLHAAGGTSYLWSPSTYLDDPTSSDPIATPLSSITYSVTSLNAGGCSDEETITINVLPIEFADASADQTICFGASTELFATGGIDYVWSPSTYLDDPSSSTPTSIPLSDITYFITVTSAEGCSDVDTVNIIIYPEIVINAGPDTTVCYGGQFKLYAEGGIEYLWVPSTNLDNPTIADPTCNPSESIDYVVFVTDLNGCVETDTVNVEVNTAPSIITNDDFTICRGDSITLTAEGGINYVWSPDPLFGCGICSSAEFVPTITTTYLVQGFDANGCSATDFVTVTVDICNGIENILADQINIYPNPAKKIIFVSSDPGLEIISVEIMNIAGEKVRSNIIINNSINEIHLSELPSQPLIIQVLTNKGAINKMIIIE